MTSLIGNEVKKVFSKWAVKVIILIAVLLMIVAVIVDKVVEDRIMENFEMSIDEQLSMYEEELKYTDKAEDLLGYVDCKTNIEVLQLEKQYSEGNDWKRECIDLTAYDLIYNLNMLKYSNTEDMEELKLAEQKYNTFLSMLENDDWKEYVKTRLEIVKSELEQYKLELKNTTISKKANLEKAVAMTEITVEMLEYRLNNNVGFDKSYLDQAIKEYEINMNLFINGEKESAKAEAMIAKYVLDTKTDVYNDDNSASLFKDYMTTTNDLFLTLIMIVISGSMISNEFSKGTIKQLLVRPYGRVKIWFSKYITSIIVLVISMIIISIFAIIIFGFAYGFDGYMNYKVGIYDYNAGNAYSMNVFIYVGIIFISKLPYFIMLGTIAIFISTLINSTAIAVAVPLLGTIAEGIVSALLLTFDKFRFLKFFITPNWDWSVYNFGKPGMYDFIDFKFSVIVYMAYLVGLVGVAVFRFKKEDIKNI